LYICEKELYMDIVIKNIDSKQDLKFISELVKRLGLKLSSISTEEKEEISLGYAIQAGLKSGLVSEKEVMKTLRKIQGK